MAMEEGTCSDVSREPLAKRARFAAVTEKDVEEAFSASVPATTKAATEFWLGVFDSFCAEKQRHLDLKTCSPKALDEALCEFYVGLRKKGGGLYKQSSYLAARPEKRF